jgi:hypothetical protein
MEENCTGSRGPPQQIVAPEKGKKKTMFMTTKTGRQRRRRRSIRIRIRRRIRSLAREKGYRPKDLETLSHY